MPSKRYRLKLATWIVVREQEEPSPHHLNSPGEVARLVQELVRASDDDREHVWVIFLNAKHHYRMLTEV
jgi:hypothetical protein